jgi:membrane protein implicated in regulation of membrane protease activity
MATGAGERPGLVGAARAVTDRARSIVRLEIELATAELKKKLATIGIGIGLLAGAAVLAFYGVGFALATIAAGLATAVSTWLALLIVTVGLLILVGVLVMFGRAAIKKGSPPVPGQAIEEAKLTAEAVKSGKY